MHQVLSIATLAAVIWLPIAIGLPHPEAPGCAGGPGSHGYQYAVESTRDVAGTPQVGDYAVSGATGNGQLTAQTTYSVGVTVEVGLELGLDLKSIAGAIGGSFSVSYTTETSTTQGVSDTCPHGFWYCALSITPTMVEVKGTATENMACGIRGNSHPYTVLMPKLGPDNNPISNAEACTCHNLKHWADDGHLALLCPGDCALTNVGQN